MKEQVIRDLKDQGITVDRYVERWIDEMIKAVNTMEIKDRRREEHFLAGIKPDIDRAKLIEWFSDTYDSMSYLDEAMEVFKPTGKMEKIAIAQWMKKIDVALAVLRANAERGDQ